MRAADARRRILVTVGTDVHPFDRLLDWTAALAQEEPYLATWEVQHGWTALPFPLEGTPFLDRDGLRAAMAHADVVVCHGGPSTIAEARACGVLPIVVPRRAAAGEHVDDHQQRFARRLAETGLVLLAEDEDAFRALLRRALEDPATVATDGHGDQGRVGKAVAAFAAAVEPLMTSGRRRPGDRLASGLLRRQPHGST